MRMAQVVSACVPNAIRVPIEGKCKRTFKLELVAEANGIRLENAHDALADAKARLRLHNCSNSGRLKFGAPLSLTPEKQEYCN
jgi:exonuclease I